MADTDTPKTSGKPTEGAGAEAAARTNSGASSPNAARAEAQAGDPYKPADGNDYSLSINPEDTGEATVANLFQAVPLEYEGSGSALHDGEGLAGDGGLNGGAGNDGPRNGLDLNRNDNVPLPDGLQDVAETSDGGLGDAGGIGDGEVPEARGLDAGLSQFDLGGRGIPTSDDGIGDGIGGGGGGGDGGTTVLADDDGDGGGDGGGGDAGDDGGDDGDDGDGGGDDDLGEPIGPLTDVNLDTNFVEENADPGTTVGVVAFAEDPDGDDVTYSILGDSPFVIDPETGVISVGPGAVIDREETPTISVTVQATSSDGSFVVETFVIEVGDDNTEFQIGPVVDTDTTDNFILEDSDPGTVVGVTAFAEDPDATDTVTYEIIGDTPFVIDPVTGVISVAPGAEIDRETTPFFDVTVQATSTDGSTSQETFRITVGDDNSEFPIGPVIDTDEDANFVQENAVGGTGIDVTAFAEDLDDTDTVSYEIVGDSPFVIDPVSGVLTVKDGAVIDREETPFIDVTVQATSTDGTTSQETFRVEVGDENEFEIGPVTDVDGDTNFVEENSDGGTIVGVTAFAEDPDATDTVSYEIIGDSPFVIDPATGVITVAPGAEIDREETPFIDVTVQATSTDGSTSQETFRVTVGDANEFGIGPVTDTDTEQNFVQENSDPGTVVGLTAFAEDPDTADTVTYEIVGDSPFVIDPASGVITVGPDADIDREATPFIDVTVKATSTDGSTSQETFRVEVGDDNEGDIGPVVDIDKSNNDLNAVAENGTGGEEVGITAFAEDPDATDTVTYSTDDPRFDIDPDTGVLTVKPGVSFDYEQTKAVDVEITATSSDGSSSTGTFTVNILDVNEAPDLTFETGDVDGVSATLTFVSEGANYSSSLGVFVMDASGDPVAGQIVWTNGNELTPGDTVNVAFPNVDAANIGYFLIPDGADQNPGIAAGDMVTFQKDGDGNWQAVAQDGTLLTGDGADAYFSGDASLNPDGLDHTVESGVTIGFEDLVNNGDQDFDDFVFDAQNTDFDYRTTIVEEVEGAEAAPLSVIDPDEGDTHTFTVSDDRFEVVVAGDKYVLKLKDDQELDYETETQVSVTVTATDTGGLSDTETIIIDVIDVNESKEPIGPLSDSDTSDNLVAENSDAGTVVGVTAFATDPDTIDTVSYEIVDQDSPFVIDPTSGVISVAPGADIDRETTPSIDVTVKATSTDGTSTTKTFTVEVGDEDEFDIGPVSDADTSDNTISETADGGEDTGITAFAEDEDATDTVTYELTGGNDRFEIDETSGVITVKDGAQFDAETESTVDVTVKATSTDGSSSSKTFSIDVTDGNEPPDLIVELENASNDLVINGGFENFSGTLSGTDGTGWYDTPDTIEGWSYNDVDIHQSARHGEGTTDGAHRLDLTADDNGTISQTIEGQLDGHVYTLSFNMNSRGNRSGEGVAEVYWNGELIDTIDPTDGGGGWQSYSYDIVGGSGDGSNTLTFVEKGSDNSHGTYIDTVSIKADGRIAILEEFKGAEVAPLSVIDPDVGDTHTFTVSDDRFEVVAADGKYLLKLKDDQALDYETEQQVTVQVTATDSGGLSDTETVIVDVIDVDENSEPIGPLSDSDNSDNLVAENSDAGTVVGVTAFATDPDTVDDVTYEIVDQDSPFVIDPTSGVLSVAPGADIDRETTPSIDVTVKATSTDGTSTTETFRVEVGDEDEFDIGPVSDVETSDNTISETADGGEDTGITAFAEDKDATDTVTYELTGGNDRFEIDETTGVITVKDGAQFDAETEPTVDVTVKATSTDGSSSSNTFSIDVGDGNEPPDLVVEYGDIGTNLIKNGSFESFDVATGKWSQFSGDSSGAWTSNGKMEVWDNFGGIKATEGDQHLELDSEKNVNSISQTVETSVGQVYDLSFDVQARRDDASNTVEVYWNGELVSTVDPAFGNWETLEVQVVGTGGNDVLEFRETSEDNNTYGAFIDNVELTGTNRIGVYEELEGAKVVPLSVIDPDVGDTHTFTVSDDRFEVVAADGKYLLKLKDDQALDYETEQQVTVQITATDTGGLSDTETVVIDVIDIDEGAEPIGPLTDSDTTANLVAENSDAGTFVGVTAFATDPDTSDDVTYEIVDQNSPFVIDPTSGVISVAPGADIDRETTPTIDVTVEATSTDGTSTTKTFTVEVGDENEFDIGPVADVDTSDNTISETSDSGENTGITAFAEDEDATDTVTYELTGGSDRFEIDETSGVITVKDGAQFDAETEPTVDVTVKATSTDGSSSSQTFPIGITDGNEPPDLIVELESGSQQFIINGSFENFDGQLGGSDGSGWYQDPNSIEGWSYDNVDVHQAGHNNFGATDGNHHLDLASVTNGWASQQIEGQMEGQVYELQFDMKSRGGAGQSVAEVYWNGELIDTIDPATTGAGWQTYNFNIVGGSGDGSNTLTFVEIGSDNNGGALIDSVSIVSDNRTAVVEEFFGAEIAPLSVIDPDIGDTHTFTVSDDRFEVVVSGDKYMLKLKDNQALDYETETQVTLEVTATDQGGLSDTEVVVIDVIDVDETNTPLTDLIDSDTSDNVIAEGATAGTVVGLTAFANEPDAGDSVTYAITDPRFEIDPDTGVVTVADNASFDAEQTPFIDLDVTATSTDGSSVTETFRIDVTEFDELPVAKDDGATVGLTKTSFYYSDDDGEIHLISSDGSDVVIGSTGVGAMTDIALDNSGNLYGITFNKLYSIDPDTGEATKISSSRFGTSMNALEFGPDGTLYAADSSGKLYTVDVSDGSLTKIGKMEYGSAGDLAFSGDKLYLSASNGKIVEIDPDSGATIDVVATLPVSNAFGLVGDEGGQLYAFTNGGRVYQIDPETGTVSVPDAYVMNDSGWGATETADSSGQTAKVEGNVLTNDTDAEGALTVTNVSFDGQDYAPGSTIPGDYGSLLINSDGTYTYILDPDSPAAQALGQGESDVEVFTYTVTDSGGNTDTANLKITVNGYDEGPAVSKFDVGPVRDADTAKNLVAASVAAGALVGLTAIAEDADAGDTVTYTIDDSRFDIDEFTGVVTVADGATLTPGETIDVVITATSSDGSESSGTFPIDVVAGSNAAPDLIVGNPLNVTENSAGAGVVALSVVDPDVGDTHTFTVSDDRFEVVPDGNGYMLKLKDGVELDYEEEQSITLDVTATDGEGLSDTETITFDVVDVDDTEDDMPPVAGDDDDDERDDDNELAASSASRFSNDGDDDDESDDEGSNVIELPTFQVGTEDDDALVGEGANDALFGKGGDDTLSGEGGSDALFGGPGDDTLDGGPGDDSMNGGDGSDVFAYMLGDGNDSIYGGAGENWIDIIDLGDGTNGTQIGEYGTDWSVTVTDGSIDKVDPLNGEVSLSQDSGGHIDLADGGRVDFAEIEGIQYS
ncbi:cadherin domain-containing protein [Roseibium alexandrii]|uniref:VCBS repeat protein n=1 Tax=Roseibium alexandrii (strain DSM 17067 / NCIMB 14079 / DFL-11) TaxID=244592 RepID=A0A5E8GXG2_ROSAD|nr:cadherin domain-containing protein [Roseibium alexandrii]EEE44441.1 VCBS repeat protein [Roseibium alexandrii DFL-11]